MILSSQIFCIVFLVNVYEGCFMEHPKKTGLYYVQ